MSLKSKFIYLTDTNPFFENLKLYYWRVKNLPDQIRVEKGIKKRKAGENDPRFERIKKYKNKHKGQRCFIVATGPSLTMEDLSQLKNEITFGMNSITKIFDKTDWRPTYYGIQDPLVYEKMEESILAAYKNSDNVFVADYLGLYFKIPNNFIPFPYNGHYHIYRGKYTDYSAEFSDNAYEVVYDGYTITYSLIQIAVYMGFEEIYLIGADSTYKKGGNNHFVESGFVDKNAHTSFNRLMTGYYEAKRYAEKHNIKIFNATRGGALEVFPRVDFDEFCHRSLKHE